MAIVALGALLLPARANTILFATGPVNLTGTSSGWVNAEVSFEINPVSDTILISVNNLQNNPVSIGQLISRIDFTLSHFTNVTPDAHLVTERATEFEVDRMGRVREVEPKTDTDWKILPVATGRFDLCTICSGGGDPDELLMGGPALNGKYTSANGSIAGNGPHNPFLLASGATYRDGPLAGLGATPAWSVQISGIQTATSVSAVRIGFGTSYGSLVAPASEVAKTPEPATWVLMGCGAGLMAYAARRKKKGRAA